MTFRGRCVLTALIFLNASAIVRAVDASLLEAELHRLKLNDDCGSETSECYATPELLTTIQEIIQNATADIPTQVIIDAQQQQQQDPCLSVVIGLRLLSLANTAWLTNLSQVVESSNLNAELYQAALDNVTHYTTCLDLDLHRWIQIGESPEMEELWDRLLEEDFEPYLDLVTTTVSDLERRREEYVQEARKQILTLWSQGEYAGAVDIFTQFNNNTELVSILDQACGSAKS